MMWKPQPAGFQYNAQRPEQIAAPATEDNYAFDDGLSAPGFVENFDLDETGAGISEIAKYADDGIAIIRTRVETGTAHGYWEYKIENAGLDVTPDGGLNTVEGADCALTKIRFEFAPKFRIIKISRPWRESWTTSTMATRTVYEFSGPDKIIPVETTPLRTVCNVSDLF
jgi:hypothetical protein